MFGEMKMIAIGIAAVLLLSVAGTLAWKYNSAMKDAEILRANNSKLEVSLQTQSETITEMEKAIVGWKNAQEKLILTMKEVNAAARAARDEARKTEAIFARHNLEALALRKPALIESRINAATVKALSGLECASSEKGC